MQAMTDGRLWAQLALRGGDKEKDTKKKQTSQRLYHFVQEGMCAQTEGTMNKKLTAWYQKNRRDTGRIDHERNVPAP